MAIPSQALTQPPSVVDFWCSNHAKWIFKREDVEFVANFRDKEYLTPEEISNFKFFISNLIQLIAKRVGLPQRVASTAIVFMRRLYVRKSFTDFHPWITAATSFYLASKVEECAIHQGQTKMIHAAIHAIDTNSNFDIEEILRFEFRILEELDFHLLIVHPYQILTDFVSDANVSTCLESIWSIINDTYYSDIPLIYPPHMVVIAAIHLAAMNHNVDVRPWIANLNIDLQELATLTKQILDYYQTMSQRTQQDILMVVSKVRQRLGDRSKKFTHSSPSAPSSGSPAPSWPS